MDLVRRLRPGAQRSQTDRLAECVSRATPYLDSFPALSAWGEMGWGMGAEDAWVFDAAAQPAAQALLDAPDADRIAIGIALLVRQTAEQWDAFDHSAIPVLLGPLGRRAPVHDAADRALVLDLALTANSRSWRPIQPVAYAASVLERARDAGEPIDAHRAAVDALLAAVSTTGSIPPAELARLRARLLRLSGNEKVALELISDNDTWGQAMRAWLRQRDDAAGFEPLLSHLVAASAVSPSKAWTKAVRELLDDAAGALVKAMIDASFTSTIVKGTYREYIGHGGFHPANATLVRGAYWAAAAGAWDWVPETLGRAGMYWALSGRNDNYARDERLANTTVNLLADLGTPETLVALGRIRVKVRNRPVTKQVVKAIERAAAAAGIPPGELLELAVPLQGLDADGHRELPVGTGAALLDLDAEGEAHLTWRTADGTVTASVPKALAESDAAAVTAAKTELKELRAALAVERARLEDLLVEDRTWPLATWRERYLEHPLTGAFARRLLWRARMGEAWRSVLPLADGWLAPDGSRADVPDGATIAVWHPARAGVEEIRAWRTTLLERRVHQPFKQAWREIYLLTPAEETTDTYSNRFAGHILDYPVARALMGARRWGSNFLGPFDGGYEGIAKREFRSHGLRAEFFHDAIEAGGYEPVEHCTTDQVRFLRVEGRTETPVHLADVPPVVFSEAMRDVDLFVGVSSIAADVNWQDGGPERVDRFGLYWNQVAFTELDASAETRREALALVLPQLAIRDRLELDGRFLRVRGDLRSYRIHLGSANILMEPDDAYLCIVPGRSASGPSKVFLPFEDDHRLSVILSKAVLLANDRAIKDPSIVAQIKR